MEDTITQLKQIRPEIPVTSITLPEGNDMNAMWLNYGTEGVAEFLNERPKIESKANGLTIHSPQKMSYESNGLTYFIIGQISMDLSNLRVSLHVVENDTQKKHRIKADLSDFLSVEEKCRELSEKHRLDYSQLETDFTKLADLLEQYKESQFEEEITDLYSEKELTPKAMEKAVAFLQTPNLMKSIDSLLEQTGIIGEQENRKILFVVTSGYKMPYPLHCMVQGTSGGGKSHLINSIAECMPQEDLLDMTRITSKSLYHYRDKELVNKLVVVQDFDGLDEEAQFAFREIQTHKKLSSSLRPYQVINPFADKIMLPLDAKMLRRLNEQFQDFVCQITLLHQYQRKTDSHGRLIATKEDIRTAVEIFFSAIILKVDELDASTRQFFESIKAYVRTKPKGTTHKFSALEIRQATNKEKSTANRYIKTLQGLEYIQQVEGSANTGFKYVISYFDDLEKLKAKVKQDLNRQLDEL